MIAADGRSGQAFVKAALEAGHQVRAGIHGKNPFFAHPNLSVIRCDATNEKQLSELLRASDAVVSLIGHVKGSKADVQTQAIRTIIAAMKRRGLTRIISLTGTGVRIAGDRPNLLDKLANAIIVRIDPDRIHDGIAHVKLLNESGLDYTVLRVLKLGNGGQGAFSLNGHGPAKPLTSRTEVAAAILDCLEDNRFVQQYPVIVRKRASRH